MSTTTVTASESRWAPITDVDEARRIAREWQSPGSIGSVLAAFASGVKVDRWRLHDDARRTQHEQPTMPLDDWANLDRLRDWALADEDGHVSGPHGNVRVITNHQPRDILRWWDLTPADLERLDYGTDDEAWLDERWFIRYRGDVVDITDADGGATGELGRKGWEAYQSDSFFSGLVFRYVDNYEAVIVGRYVA
jgi:hypothetical protein